MSADRLINKLSVTASLVLAVTLCASLGVVAWPRVASALGLEPARPAPAYSAGDRIDVPAAWYETAPRTLVLFARASCGACQTAQPFLKELVGAVVESGDAVVLVGHAGSREEDAVFAKSLGVGDAGIQSAPAGVRVRVTPTLVLVDKSGTVLNAWEGVGPPDKQKLIAAATAAAVR